MATSNKCVKCGQQKAASEFHAHPTNRNRLQSYCKACSKAYRSKRQKAAPVPADLKRARRKAYEARYPEKARAVKTVDNALRAGTLRKQSCERCGAANTHAHHDDYARPLDVRWLCPSHHMALHRELRLTKEAA